MIGRQQSSFPYYSWAILAGWLTTSFFLGRNCPIESLFPWHHLREVAIFLLVILLQFRSIRLTALACIPQLLCIWIAHQVTRQVDFYPLAISGLDPVTIVACLASGKTLFCLFTIRQEREMGYSISEACWRGLRRIARTSFGFLLLVVGVGSTFWLAISPAIQHIAIFAWITIFVSTTVVFMLTPALLILFGTEEFSESRLSRTRVMIRSGVAHRWFQEIISRPTVYFSAGMLTLFCLSLFAIRTASSKSEEPLPPQELRVFLSAETSWNSAVGNNTLAELERSLREFPNVQGVSKLIEPEDHSRVQILLTVNGGRIEGEQTLRIVETWIIHLLPNQTFSMGRVLAEVEGTPVTQRFSDKMNTRDKRVVYGSSLVVLWLLLWVAFGNWWLSLFVALLQVLVLFASLGLAPIRGIGAGAPAVIQVWAEQLVLAIWPVYLMCVIRGKKTRLISFADQWKRDSRAIGITSMMLALSLMVQTSDQHWGLLVGLLLNTTIINAIVLPSYLALIWENQEEPEVMIVNQRPIGQVIVRTA